MEQFQNIHKEIMQIRQFNIMFPKTLASKVSLLHCDAKNQKVNPDTFLQCF